MIRSIRRNDIQIIVHVVSKAILFQISFTHHDLLMATASKTPLITSKSSDSISSLSEHERCGYMIHNIASIINKWKCVYCFYLIKEPIQLTECGHRACRGCFESRAQLAAADEPMTCPNVDCATSFDRSQVQIIGEHRPNGNLDRASILVHGRQSIQARDRCTRGVLLSQGSRELPVDWTADGLPSSFGQSSSFLIVIAFSLGAPRHEAHALRMQALSKEILIQASPCRSCGDYLSSTLSIMPYMWS